MRLSDRGVYRVTGTATGTIGDKVEHFVPFNRRRKPGHGVEFVAETLTNCENLAVEYVDTGGFVLSAQLTAAGGNYTVECAWETYLGGEAGNGRITEKLKDAIRANRGIVIEELSGSHANKNAGGKGNE